MKKIASRAINPYFYKVMEKAPGLQQIFFQQIRNQVPDNLSFVNEVAGLLEISSDSAYRRIRGEKELSLDEMLKLGMHYGISLDATFNIRGNSVVFSHHGLQSGTEKINQWLSLIIRDFHQASKARTIDIIYAAKDPPIWQYFQFPEIAAFKFFFWNKTLFEDPEHEDKLFSLDDTDSDNLAIGRDLLKVSMNLPTTEIWNEDTFNMFTRQLEYYWLSGYFKKRDDLLNLMDKLEKWVRHMQKQADHGFKFIYGEPAEGRANSFKMYHNEVVLNDNAIFARIDNITSVYLTYNVISLLISREPGFCRDVELFLQGLITKSNLISLSGEKARNLYFNKLMSIISASKARLSID